jgi:HPt (histidine-containing phosphotransfer) domain-containing protein
VAELPDRLGPFDIAEALKRVNGKAGLLRKLIVSFAATYGHAGQDIRDRIAAGQIADARRLAHSLKGVAGSLELRELQACASDVEQRLAHEDLIPALAAIQALEPELDRAVAAAGKLAEAALPKGEAVAPHARPAPSDDGRDLSAACDELRALLRRRSLGARSAFERLAQDMGLDDAERAAHPLHHALQRLDYVAALALLEGLAGGAERLPITESTAPQAAFSQGIPS